MKMDNRAYLNAAANLKNMVRDVIDCDFATKLSFDDLNRQLAQVAHEVEAACGFTFSNAERLQEMQLLAEELTDMPVLARAA